MREGDSGTPEYSTIALYCQANMKATLRAANTVFLNLNPIQTHDPLFRHSKNKKCSNPEPLLILTTMYCREQFLFNDLKHLVHDSINWRKNKIKKRRCMYKERNGGSWRWRRKNERNEHSNMAERMRSIALVLGPDEGNPETL